MHAQLDKLFNLASVLFGIQVLFLSFVKTLAMLDVTISVWIVVWYWNDQIRTQTDLNRIGIAIAVSTFMDFIWLIFYLPHWLKLLNEGFDRIMLYFRFFAVIFSILVLFVKFYFTYVLYSSIPVFP